MKKASMSLTLAVALGMSSAAWGANWLQLQGNEPPNASTLKVWGFIQPTYVQNEGGAVSGLKGHAAITAYNGQNPIFNTVNPDQTHRAEFNFLRARLGIRGFMPGTHKKTNYFVLAEVGKNGLTRQDDLVLSDASLTFNYIPGARIRVGLFKDPTGEEALQGIPTLNYINFTTVTNQLLNERVVRLASAVGGRNTAPTTLAHAKVIGSVSGFRGVGIQVYDWFRRRQWEYTYAIKISNGNGINTLNDNNSDKDVTARLSAAYIFGGKGPRRQDVTAYIWHQEGKRSFGDQKYNRIREGFGIHYLRHGIRLGGEYLRGSGMIFAGPNPPFKDIGAPAFEPLATVALDSSNKADGWYLESGWRFLPKWEAELRYSKYDRLTNSQPLERKFTTWTIGGQYFVNRRTRVTLNYDIRDLKVANPGAITNAVQRDNAETIANAMGNQISLQLTYIF